MAVVAVFSRRGLSRKYVYVTWGGGPAQTSHPAKKNKKCNQNGVTWGGVLQNELVTYTYFLDSPSPGYRVP